jgi:hypothetical protein
MNEHYFFNLRKGYLSFVGTYQSSLNAPGCNLTGLDFRKYRVAERCVGDGWNVRFRRTLGTHEMLEWERLMNLLEIVEVQNSDLEDLSPGFMKIWNQGLKKWKGAENSCTEKISGETILCSNHTEL